MPTSISQVQNLSNLAAPQYKLVFQKLPGVVFKCQRVNLPGVSLGSIDQPSPTHLIPIPDNAVAYDPLSISFMVDENMANWIEIHNWIVGLGAPVSTDQYATLRAQDTIRTKFGGIYSDATLISLNNASLANKKVIYRECFPISLSPIEFDSTETQNGVIVGEASFMFIYYLIEDL